MGRRQPNIVVEAKTGPAPVSVHVADFFFRGTLRAVLKPLIDDIPCFAAVSVSLVTKPSINFRLSTVGVSVMSVPGLNEFLYDLIKSQMAAFIVWPKKVSDSRLMTGGGLRGAALGPTADCVSIVVVRAQIVVPIKKLSADVLTALNSAESQGILYVRVKGAKDIKGGESYAKVSVGSVKKKTVTRKHSGAVEWKEQFDFLVRGRPALIHRIAECSRWSAARLPPCCSAHCPDLGCAAPLCRCGCAQVHDVENEVVVVEVKSKENVLLNTVNTLVINHLKSSRSTALGDVSLPVNRFSTDAQANVAQELWLPLHHQHKGRAGQVHLELTWSPFVRDEADSALSASASSALGSTAAGAETPELLRRRSTRSRLTDGKIPGVLLVTVHSASGLKKPSGHAPHAAYAVVTAGDHHVKTATASGEVVKWEASFELRVDDCADATVRLEVKERTATLSMSLGMAKDALLGELVLSAVRLHKQGRKTETLPLQHSQSATITLTTEIKET